MNINIYISPLSPSLSLPPLSLSLSLSGWFTRSFCFSRRKKRFFELQPIIEHGTVDENCNKFRNCFGSNRNNLGENGPKKDACFHAHHMFVNRLLMIFTFFFITPPSFWLAGMKKGSESLLLW